MNTDFNQTYVKKRFGGEEDTNSFQSLTLENETFPHLSTFDTASLFRNELPGRPAEHSLTGPTALQSDDVQALYRRIRELEQTVFELNTIRMNYDVTKRNYSNALDQLARKKAENAVLVESREKYYTETKFLEEQLQEQIKENEKHCNRIDDLNASLCRACRDLNTSEERIKELESQLLKLKDDSQSRSVTESEPQNVRGDLSSHRVEEGVQVNSAMGVRMRDATGSLPSKRRRHEFSTSRTVLPNCRNCNAVFDKVKPHETSCCFHRIAPQPLKTWQPQLESSESVVSSVDMQAYKFWPCCGKAGLKEPPGCLKLKNHDIVYPDEE